uniref:RxLR effector candidate protein n=1 Tax=Hyaloperonospora arabidopsidis (strain Emoy2) TaxID=559515 RepID=M4BB13_HYAAE
MSNDNTGAFFSTRKIIHSGKSVSAALSPQPSVIHLDVPHPPRPAVALTTSGKPNVISNEVLSAISVQTPWIETNCPLPIYWENRKIYAYLISGWIRRSTYLPNVKSKWLLSEQLAIKDSVIYELVIIKAAYLTRRRLVHTSDGAVDDYGFERDGVGITWTSALHQCVRLVLLCTGK